MEAQAPRDQLGLLVWHINVLLEGSGPTEGSRKNTVKKVRLHRSGDVAIMYGAVDRRGSVTCGGCWDHSWGEMCHAPSVNGAGDRKRTTNTSKYDTGCCRLRRYLVKPLSLLISGL